MIDYTIYYKHQMPVDRVWDDQWDLFISGYNSSDRVVKLFGLVNAAEKHWLVFPEHHYTRDEYPTNGHTFYYALPREDDFILAYANESKIDRDVHICIDITGFIRPHAMFLIRWLASMGAKKFDVVYSEPLRYKKREETQFSDEHVQEVRQVAGFEGMGHTPDTSNDLLVIGAGYDDRLIAAVAYNKNHARKLQIFGLPSLKPDMYQQNVLRAQRAAEAVGASAGNEPINYFAPANDPFVVAAVLQSICDRENRERPVTNLYLSPLATKPQLLGFTLYYLTECIGKPVSMIFPFCDSYNRETSEGLYRAWKYTVELP